MGSVQFQVDTTLAPCRNIFFGAFRVSSSKIHETFKITISNLLNILQSTMIGIIKDKGAMGI